MRENRDSIYGKGIHIMPAALKALTVLSGRQKTPDEAVVMGKGGGQLGEKRQDAEISVSEILPCTTGELRGSQSAKHRPFALPQMQTRISPKRAVFTPLKCGRFMTRAARLHSG